MATARTILMYLDTIAMFQEGNKCQKLRGENDLLYANKILVNIEITHQIILWKVLWAIQNFDNDLICYLYYITFDGLTNAIVPTRATRISHDSCWVGGQPF